MNNAEKRLAVADAHERLLEVRPHYDVLATILKDPAAGALLEEIDRTLGRLRAEARRLEAERTGASTPGEASEEHREAERHREARDLAAAIDHEFEADLARMGYYQQPDPATRRHIAHRAFAHTRDRYGERAAERCRLVLDQVNRTLGQPTEVDAT